jgi:hypothetical protein
MFITQVFPLVLNQLIVGRLPISSVQAASSTLLAMIRADSDRYVILCKQVVTHSHVEPEAREQLLNAFGRLMRGVPQTDQLSAAQKAAFTTQVHQVLALVRSSLQRR